MRHNKKINHLGRTKAHREAMLANMASSLIKHKRIFTTTAKAKALRKYIEPLITKSKDSSKPNEAVTHSRRIVFASLQDKYAVKELFGVVAEKIGDRPGGYTRIIKTGARLGDNAAMCFIELVDFNENMLKDASKKVAAKTRRSRKKSSAVAESTPSVGVKDADVVVEVEEVTSETSTVKDDDPAISEAVTVEEVDETSEADKKADKE
ncbi:MAG: 50S ribosomal protein L17 [Tannerella sp.]|jgi:large subunit ribosomal protein L17|nr:50S ribosomal protein L17 [Tannerella sp.]